MTQFVQNSVTNQEECARQSKSILVIEDEQVILETLQLALEIEGYTVVCAANGKEGLDLLAKIPTPGLILLDLMMPVMNGWEFVEQIEANEVYARIPIVLVTAYIDQVGALKGKIRGMIPKPVNLTALFEVAKKWCRDPIKVNE